MNRVKEVTEEVARWVFEVQVDGLKDWRIAFTNPTAGPWKLVVGTDRTGRIGEVHRFERESSRPDLIIYSDVLEVLLIAEAKGPISDLIRGDQVEKSVSVVKELGALLRSKDRNSFWHSRSGFEVVPAILWGSESATERSIAIDVLGRYEEAARASGLSAPVIGIESLRAAGGEEIICRGHCSDAPQLVKKGLTVNALMQSLALDLPSSP